MESKCITSPNIETSVTAEVKCGELQVPDHAIRRFARFLLPKIQADRSETQQNDESNLG